MSEPTAAVGTNRQAWAEWTGSAVHRKEATSPFLLPSTPLCCGQLAGLAGRLVACNFVDWQTSLGNSFQNPSPSLAEQSVNGMNQELRGNRPVASIFLYVKKVAPLDVREKKWGFDKS